MSAPQAHLSVSSSNWRLVTQSSCGSVRTALGSAGERRSHTGVVFIMKQLISTLVKRKRAVRDGTFGSLVARAGDDAVTLHLHTKDGAAMCLPRRYDRWGVDLGVATLGAGARQGHSYVEQ